MVFMLRFMARILLERCGYIVEYYDYGIPIGRQVSNFAALGFLTFGKEIKYGGSPVSMVANIFWIILSGIPLALSSLLNGVLLCCTIIGIPFGRQCFKFVKLALAPFGATVN